MAELPQIRASALEYQKRYGLQVPEADYTRALITERASHQIGQAYGRMAEFNRSAVPAFRAMGEEVKRQFDHMTSPTRRGGLGMDVEVTKHDPYGGDNLNEIYTGFRGDVENNNRIKVLDSASTGGHPIFSNDENNMFRAVHDVYGHLGSGRGIDYDGEEAAFQKHSRMFTPQARQALASETRGQNSSFRANGEFPDQKVGVLPAHMQSLQFSRIGAASELAAAARRASAMNKEQGI